MQLIIFRGFFSVLLLSVLSACSGGGGAAGSETVAPGSPTPQSSGVPAPSGGAGATAPAGSGEAAVAAGSIPRFAYSAGGDRIQYYLVDARSGGMRLNGYLYLGQAIAPKSISMAPSSRFAYAVNGNKTVTAYAVDLTTGTLTQVGTPVPTGDSPDKAVVHPSGQFVYVGNAGSQDIYVYRVDATTGALTPMGSPVAAGASVKTLKMDGKGQFLYAMTTQGMVAYRIDGNTGALSQVGTASMANPSSEAVHPSGKFVYLTGYDGSQDVLAIYGVDPQSGALAPLARHGFGTSLTLTGVEFNATGDVAYLSSYGGGLRSYSVDSTSGDVVAELMDSDRGGQANTYAVTFDPSKHLLFANSLSSLSSNFNNVGTEAFNIDSSGKLQLSAFVHGDDHALATGAVPVSYTPTYAYVANYDANNLSVYSIDPTSGNLQSLGTAPTGGHPFSVTVDKRNRFVYVANFGDNTVSSYAINANGSLAPVNTVASGTGPKSVSLDPGGRFAYVANYNSGNVSMYRVDPNTGALTSLGAGVAAGQNPNAILVDPTGKYVYVTNTDNTVSGFAINGDSGVLTPLAGSPYAAGNNPYGIAIDPSGQYVYVTNLDGRISYLKMVPSTGSLSLSYYAPSYSAGTQPYGLCLDPSGRFLYAANGGSGNISAYRQGFFGGLTAMANGPFAAGTNTQAIQVDASGRFAYAVNYDSNDVWIYAIDPATGALSRQGSIAASAHPVSLALAYRYR